MKQQTDLIQNPVEGHIGIITLYIHIKDPFRNKLQYVVSPVFFFFFYLLAMALSSPVGCVRLKLSPTLGFSGLGLVMVVVVGGGWGAPLLGRGPHML